MNKQTQQNKTINEVSGFGVANDNAYFLNSPEIRTVDSLLIHDQDYLLLNVHPKEGMKFISVKFITARERDGWVILDFLNNQRPERLSKGVPMAEGESRRYPFVVMDLDSLALELNIKMKQKVDYLADKGSSTDVIPGWDCILELIRDETEKYLNPDKLLDFEF